MSIEAIIKNPETTIIDVRTSGEYQGGNVAGSINIPLNEVPERIADFKDIKGEIVLCCMSGARSGQATMFLQQNGFENVTNGGGWMQVNAVKNN